MTDRFKFRVWDKENNKYEDDLYYEAGDLQVTCVNEIFEEYISDGKYIIEQCTGLKDKNGKLVYEGDVIKTHLKRKGVVLWNEICWCYRTLDKAGCTYIMESYDIEIVGNIHENNNLLKG